jgi:hypothetical protein
MGTKESFFRPAWDLHVEIAFCPALKRWAIIISTLDIVIFSHDFEFAL